jgi:hypothetical protein
LKKRKESRLSVAIPLNACLKAMKEVGMSGVSNFLFNAAKGLVHPSMNAVRRLSTEVRLQGRLVTTEEVLHSHGIHLLKNVRFRFEEGSRMNIKDPHFKALFDAVTIYQNAQQKWYQEGEISDLLDSNWHQDLLEAQYQDSLVQKTKDAYFHVIEESKKVKVTVDL